MKKDSNQNRAIKYRIYPTPEQQILMAKTFGCVRFVYNKGLELCQKMHQNGEKYPGEFGLNYALTDLKKTFEWLYEVDATALTSANGDLNNAFQKFFKHQNNRPAFKKKRTGGTYTAKCVNGNIKIEDGYIRLPKLGMVKACIHRMPKDGWQIKKATVSQKSDGTYYASICFAFEKDIKKIEITEDSVSVGLDYKSDGLYRDSNGELPDMPKFYRKNQKKLARLQRSLSKKQGSKKGEKKSNNWLKQQKKVNKLHVHIANKRLDFLHKESLAIAKRADIVCVEDLNMKALSNKGFHNGKATMDNGYGIFLKLLEYKLNDRGKYFVKVDKWFPSSQICSGCGAVRKIELSERTYICPDCGKVIDRDLNAAINIRNEGLRILKELLSD